MSAGISVRLIIALAAFFAFAYLASREKSVAPSPEHPQPVALDTVSARPDVPVHPRSFEQLALSLPDSLLPFRRGLATRKEIALSFDACPTGGKNHFNKAVLNALVRTKTPATVFLSGRWIEEDSSALQLLDLDSLIEFGNHSFSHPHMTQLSEREVDLQLDRTQQIIQNLSGRRPTLFRAPYGELNDTLIERARRAGLVTVQFDVESGDPDTSFTSERLIRWVTREARNGSVIIMHINNRGWHTGEALPTIIDNLRTRGFQLVKVSDLIREMVENAGVDSLRIGRKNSLTVVRR